MTAYCGKCGTPFGATGKFCASCGLPRPADTTAHPAVPAPPAAAGPPAQAVAAKTGISSIKLLVILAVIAVGGIVLAAGTALYVGQKKLKEFRQAHATSGTVAPNSASGAASEGRPVSSQTDDAAMLLTKEEVGAIIGVPVTSIEMQGKQDALYKTATMGMEASIEFERKNGDEDAAESMAAARKVTQSMFGGKAAPVATLGDEAVYGAFNVLYVRKNDLFLTITPPNLQQAAQMKQYNDMTSQPMGSDAQKESLEKLVALSKGDHVTGSLSKPDAVSGAVDIIQHAATESGNEYETKSREMARQMAEKVLAKL